MELSTFFEEHSKVAVAFSGGVDSAYLLYAAKTYGADVKAYYVKSPFQPQFELEDAKRFAGDFKIDLTIIPVEILGNDQIADNPANRCYFCKRQIFGTICKQAKEDGFEEILDGTNASDEVSDRPGMKALEELRVLSPLRMCGLTKIKIRELSREAGLFTWDKPAYACLATRIPAGQRITLEDLQKTERAEVFLASIGFKDFRVRMDGTKAKLQVQTTQMELVIEKRQVILDHLKQDYTSVVLDLEAR